MTHVRDRESRETPVPPGRQVIALQSSGRARRYCVHIPSGVDPATPLPVVVILHGAGASGSLYLDKNGWAAKADREKFIALAPDGLPAAPDVAMSFDKNPRVWNTGQLKSDGARARIDDVAFVGEALDDLANRTAIELRRIYLVGHSNGAGMAFRLATELSERFAALGAVASHCWVKDPKPHRGLPTLFMVGTADPIVPMAGGDVAMPWGGQQAKPAVAITLATWAQALGCKTEATTLSRKDSVRIDYYEPLTGGPALTAYFLEGHGHGWPGGSGGDQLPSRFLGPEKASVNATDVLWGFFKRHQRSE